MREKILFAAGILSIAAGLILCSRAEEQTKQAWVSRMISCENLTTHEQWVSMECSKAFKEAMK